MKKVIVSITCIDDDGVKTIVEKDVLMREPEVSFVAFKSVCVAMVKTMVNKFTGLKK